MLGYVGFVRVAPPSFADNCLFLVVGLNRYDAGRGYFSLNIVEL